MSLLVATWVTALATAGLLVGAAVTAVYAIRGFRTQAMQLKEQHDFSRLQAEEIRASIAAHEREASEHRPEQASHVSMRAEESPFMPEKLLAATEQAPSIFNSKPWSFSICGFDHIELRAKPDVLESWQEPTWLDTEGGIYFHPLVREFTISCGAALFNLRMAIRVGAWHDAEIRLMPDPVGDPALLASVKVLTSWTRPPTATEQELYEAIKLPQQFQPPVTGRLVPRAVLSALESELEYAAFAEGVSLRLLGRYRARQWLSTWARAKRALVADPKDWPPQERDRYRRARDSISRFTGPAWPWGLHPGIWPGWGLGPVGRDRRARWFGVRTRLLALSTTGDGTLDWLRAGQALQQALLTATLHGWAAFFLNEPLELDDLRFPRRRHHAAPQLDFDQMIIGFALAEDFRPGALPGRRWRRAGPSLRR